MTILWLIIKRIKMKKYKKNDQPFLYTFNQYEIKFNYHLNIINIQIQNNYKIWVKFYFIISLLSSLIINFIYYNRLNDWVH